MFFIGKKPEPVQEKTSTLKIVLIALGVVTAVAAIGYAAYKLYKKYVPACIDCECEDFLYDEDLFDDNDDVEVRVEDAAETSEP